MRTAIATAAQVETHGSVHLNPVYTSTLVKFIDAHSK